ncbi:MAG: lipoate--protein ligase family protein [Planctomycetota bacterium]
MLLLDLTLPTPGANLALEEALLDRESAPAVPVLRLWEFDDYFVVLGRSSRIREVHAERCQTEGVPILRRASGGGVVLAGPGCLMYSLVLPQETLGRSRGIDAAHSYVLGRMVHSLQPAAPSVIRSGTSDLTLSIDGARMKFSGNALRMRANRFLYHGSLLYNFDLARVSRLLSDPVRTPDYRGDRGHEGFVTNLHLSRAELRKALISEWSANEPLLDPPIPEAEALAKTKYVNKDWNFKGQWPQPSAIPFNNERNTPQ